MTCSNGVHQKWYEGIAVGATSPAVWRVFNIQMKDVTPDPPLPQYVRYMYVCMRKCNSHVRRF